MNWLQRLVAYLTTGGKVKLPLPEPYYDTGFKPPDHWAFQCPKCGARVETSPVICWRCNYGADGDDYEYRRFMHYRHGIGPNPDEQRKPPATGKAPTTKRPRRDDPPEDSPYVPVNTRN